MTEIFDLPSRPSDSSTALIYDICSDKYKTLLDMFGKHNTPSNASLLVKFQPIKMAFGVMIGQDKKFKTQEEALAAIENGSISRSDCIPLIPTDMKKPEFFYAELLSPTTARLISEAPLKTN